MTERPNILVICGRNKRRSRTAEYLFKNDMRLNIRSAGLSPSSDRKLSEKDISWSDLILVMERPQRTRIRELYAHLELQEIIVLHIPDEYEFMNEDLAGLLTEKINGILKQQYGL